MQKIYLVIFSNIILLILEINMGGGGGKSFMSSADLLVPQSHMLFASPDRVTSNLCLIKRHTGDLPYCSFSWS